MKTPFSEVRYFFGQALFEEPEIEPIQLEPDYWDEVGTCEWKRDKDRGATNQKWKDSLVGLYRLMADVDENREMLRKANEEVERKRQCEINAIRSEVHRFVDDNQEKILEMRSLLGFSSWRLFDIFQRILFPRRLNDGDFQWFADMIRKHKIAYALRK